MEDPHQVRDALTALKPTLMCAVPRFYEKIYAAIWDKVNQAPSHRQTLFNWAIRSAQSHLLGKKTTFLNRLQYIIADKLVLSKLRSLLGGKIRMMPCGGAKLEPSIGIFSKVLVSTLNLGMV